MEPRLALQNSCKIAYTSLMPLYITATYKVKKESVKKIKKAIENFTAYVKEHEPGTKLYKAWQDEKDETKFIHFFIFKDQEAQIIHSNSEEVKKFEAIYTPELVDGPVKFVHYAEVATNK
jgi:quinol monooxygenase YgiN